MSKYSSPLFGTLDFSPYLPPALDLFAFDVRNDAANRLANSTGQIYQGDYLINMTYAQLGTNYDFGFQAYDNAKQGTIISNPERPLAWLAVPAFFGNNQDTKQGGYNANNAWCIKEWHENPCFYYFLFGKTKGASVNIRMNTKVDKLWYNEITRASTFRTQGNPAYAERPLWLRTDTVSQAFVNGHDSQLLAWIPNSNILNFINNLTLWNGNSAYGRKYNAYTQEYGFMSPLLIANLLTAFNAWKALENSVYEDMRVWTDGIGLIRSPHAGPVIGSNLISGLPIFTPESLNEMIKYFQGDAWIADNDTPPPADWSTDWDIYVKGAQKPDIFITMKSDKVDEWLASDKNTSGIEKSDITVEYRYERWEPPSSAQPAPVNVLYPTKLEGYQKIPNDIYDNTKSTSYLENLSLNYDLVEEIVFANEFRDMDVIQYQYYAQLQFRISYAKKYYSAWCRYKIGVIGSPSVTDFSKMKNIGEQLQEQDVIDKSTVTLHYDEYPDGYNPYPEPPDPDMPKPKPTDPSPSVNGTGLLTTTYKVTEANARLLGDFLWGGDLVQKIKALNANPIQNIVGLYYMPINIAGDTSVIVIGNVDTNINGDVVPTQTPIYELGSVEWKGRYQTFLDFEPHTVAHIFLPFVGFVRISPADFTNHTLRVVYTYDIICGICNALLFADNIYIESHQGQCGIDVPLVASNRAQVAVGLATSLFNTAISAAKMSDMGGLAVAGAGTGAINSIMSAADSFQSQRQGSYSPACAWAETRECFIVIESANASYTSTYNHDFGRPCMASYSISQLHGFTMIDPNTELKNFAGATDEEMRMIRELLTQGFYA